ncbi:MAG: LexA family transcriptional regulator [Ruminococcaceae bacterium]|nr:LexA family transcriptional regulator [Oscillospiraceae bacterium]
MNIGETLKKLRKSKGCSQTKTASFLSANGCPVTQRAVSNWERGETMPSGEQLILLCKFYNVHDILSVFCGESGLTANLNEAGKKRVFEYIRLLENDSEFSLIKKQEKIVRTIPLYNLPVSAGTGQLLDSSDYELIEADDTAAESASFAVRVRGDSMMPRFADGEIIYIKQQQTLENGECGIFILNGEVYCKLLSRENGVQLISVNASYLPINVSYNDEFRVLGKVLS